MIPAKGFGAAMLNRTGANKTQEKSGSSSISKQPASHSQSRSSTPFAVNRKSTSWPVGQNRQILQPPPSQYNQSSHGLRHTKSATNNQQRVIPTLQNLEPLSNDENNSSTPETGEDPLEDNAATHISNEDTEEDPKEWKPEVYAHLNWGESPLDPFKSVSVAQFEKPNVGVNATKNLTNIVINQRSLRFQRIVGKQIRYNLHPAGQHWKWVPERTKKLYWDQFKRLVTWDIEQFSDEQIKEGYINYLKEHAYSNILTRIRNKRPVTVNDFTWSVVKEYMRSKQFLRASKSGKKNRLAGGDRCKQYGGSRAAVDVATQELRATGKEINPVKMYGTYHPDKRKNGELITCASHDVIKEALSKLYDVCQDDSPQQSEPSSQEESSTTPNISSAKLSSRYLEIVGCNKKRVLGTGSYSKAFLHRVSVCNAEHSSSSRARRLHDFCVFWDARMREFLISEGDQLPPEMPIVDDIIQDKEPDSQPKNFEQTWLPFLKSMGIDAPSFFATSESSKDSMDSLDE